MSALQTILAIAGLALVTLVARGFFLIPEREVPIPEWLREALRYAPLAALVAVMLPEIVLTDGHLLSDWRDPRLYATFAAAAWFWWRRDLLGTILAGTAVLLVLRIWLGW